MTCPICKSGEVFAGNASEFGMVVDLYHPCACPEPTDEDAPDWEPYVEYESHFNDARYEGF